MTTLREFMNQLDVEMNPHLLDLPVVVAHSGANGRENITMNHDKDYFVGDCIMIWSEDGDCG